MPLTTRAGARPLRVVFAMLSEPGHYAGTFRLARALVARGHRVLYLGLADCRPWVEAQGFELASFAEELLPAGHLGARAAERVAARAGAGARRGRRERERLFRAFLGQVLDGPLDRRLADCRPDVVVADTFVWYVALRALALDLPTLDLSIILSARPNGAAPPITSGLRPRAAWWSPLLVRAAWSWLRLEHLFTKRLAARLLGRFRAPTRMHHLEAVFRTVARRSGYRLEEGVTWWYGEMGPRLALDEIVLCPRVFQLPGAPHDRRVYAGDAIDHERREPALPPGALDAAKPLVYASLGSSPSFYPYAERFFAAVAGAARRRPDWQLALHVGDHPARERIAAAAPGVLVAAELPQLALLRRAAALVSHGGLNSIREAIDAGVPMVIAPAMRDQPGNAVRAERLGIARTARMATLDPESLVNLVEGVMGDETLRRNLERVRREVAAEGGVDGAVERVESTAAAGGRARGAGQAPKSEPLEPAGGG